MDVRVLNLGHKVIAGTLIAFSFGGLAFVGQRFWSLIQHFKVVYPPTPAPPVDGGIPTPQQPPSSSAPPLK